MRDIVVYVDASFDPARRVAGIGIFVTRKGEAYKHYSRPVHAATSELAEISAIEYGFHVVPSDMQKNISAIRSDSASAVALLSGKTRLDHREPAVQELVKDVRALIGEIPVLKIGRSENREADGLAYKALMEYRTR